MNPDWLIPVGSLSEITNPTHRNAWILPDDSVWVLDHESQELVPIQSDTDGAGLPTHISNTDGNLDITGSGTHNVTVNVHEDAEFGTDTPTSVGNNDGLLNVSGSGTFDVTVDVNEDELNGLIDAQIPNLIAGENVTFDRDGNDLTINAGVGGDELNIIESIVPEVEVEISDGVTTITQETVAGNVGALEYTWDIDYPMSAGFPVIMVHTAAINQPNTFEELLGMKFKGNGLLRSALMGGAGLPATFTYGDIVTIPQNNFALTSLLPSIHGGSGNGWELVTQTTTFEVSGDNVIHLKVKTTSVPITFSTVGNSTDWLVDIYINAIEIDGDIVQATPIDGVPQIHYTAELVGVNLSNPSSPPDRGQVNMPIATRFTGQNGILNITEPQTTVIKLDDSYQNSRLLGDLQFNLTYDLDYSLLADEETIRRVTINMGADLPAIPIGVTDNYKHEINNTVLIDNVNNTSESYVVPTKLTLTWLDDKTLNIERDSTYKLSLFSLGIPSSLVNVEVELKQPEVYRSRSVKLNLQEVQDVSFNEA